MFGRLILFLMLPLMAVLLFGASGVCEDGWDFDDSDPSLMTSDIPVQTSRPRKQAAGSHRQTGASASDSLYDPLPLRYEDMNPYDKIAMEPFKDRYDNLSVGEKAEIYGRQFEFMRNRKPNFDPAVTEIQETYQRAKEAPNTYDAKKYLYKPATPKKRRPKPKPKPEAEQMPNQQPGGGNLLEALPGPWERVPQPEAEPEPETDFDDDFEDEEDFQNEAEYPRDGLRMENLRQGWNARDIMRGTRRR